MLDIFAFCDDRRAADCDRRQSFVFQSMIAPEALGIGLSLGM
jgi:hypothetical protein